jgi:YidC/Oxa1 family membrane protein insertase
LHLTLAAGFFGIDHFTPPWDVFFLPLFNLLVLSYRLIFSDFALAIIVFTVVVRTIVAPLFVQQIRSQREMQRMQPLVREVQRKHKGNAQKIAQETQALYREHGVNQFGGCLPLIIQMPILFALYQALIRASNVVTLTAEQVKDPAFTALKAAEPGIQQIGNTTTFHAPVSGPCNLPQFNGAFPHFLPLNCQLITPLHFDPGQAISTVSSWLINPFTGAHLDLAQPDHVFALVIPGVGFGLSLLAVIAAILQFVQVKMTAPVPNPDDPTSGATSTMTYIFPLLTVFWGGLFASGLILYWIVYTGYLVGHQFLMMGWGNLFPIFGWSPRWAPRPPNQPPPRLPPKEPSASRGSSGDGAKPQPSAAGGQRTAVGQRSAPGRPAARRSGTQRKRGRKR